MNIGIIGSGTVGKTLAEGFIKHGYKIKIGSRSPEDLKEWKDKSGPNASTGTFDEVAKFGELIILCVKGSAGLHALELAGKDNLKNKVIIDTTNPIANEGPVNGVLKFFTDYNSSLMEQFQDKYKESRFVKAFNSIGSALMVNPDFGSTRPSMFICGNDDKAKKEVSKILDQFGFDVEDMGKAESARAIEPLCILWCIPGFLNNEWTTNAFKFLKKK